MSAQNPLPEKTPLVPAGAIAWNDVQGILYRGGYKMHKSSMLILLRVTNKKQAGAWLTNLASDNDFATGRDVEDSKVIGKTPFTIAFSAPGLRALGISDDEMLQFSKEYNAGMAPRPLDRETTTRRSGMLGDVGKNSPENWNWGACKSKANPHEVHIILNIYASTQSDVTQKYNSLIKQASGVQPYHDGKGESAVKSIIATYLREDHCEQFGYRDGISQPFLKGEAKSKNLDENTHKLHCVSPGELLIGYETERKQPILVPHVRVGKPDSPDEFFAFGKNGSYLVVRQLAQHVVEFHKMLNKAASKYREYDLPATKGAPDPAVDWVAARIMGRQFSGHPVDHERTNFSAPPAPRGFNKTSSNNAAPVTGPFPKEEDETKRYPNDFKYQMHDADGLTCPLTAHVRRAFPRDALGADPTIALKIANRHRIFRRGRLYGKNPMKQAQNKTCDPSSVEAKSVGTECGLVFMAFNADIAGQFETVQHSWINNQHFAGRYDDIDPVAGLGDKSTLNHTIQQCPINMHLENIAGHVTVRGGGYFFMPGIEAVGVLGKIAAKR